jgi:hypothetical protein
MVARLLAGLQTQNILLRLSLAGLERLDPHVLETGFVFE